MMMNERILPYETSQKLTAEDLQDVSAAGTSVGTLTGTYNPQSGPDGTVDANIDM